MASFESWVSTLKTTFMESQGRSTPEEQRVLFEKVQTSVVDAMKFIPELSVEAEKVGMHTSRQANMTARL